MVPHAVRPLRRPQLIFDREFLNACGAAWHLRHFACWDCDKDLRDTTHVQPEGTGGPVCTSCFNAYRAPSCGTCGDKVLAGVSAKQVRRGKMAS